MSNLTDVEVADFQRLAQEEGQTLTMEEARLVATRLLFLYRHLAKPTPAEKAAIERSRRGERIVELIALPGSITAILLLKRGNRRGKR
jgi:hypothetical protein